MPIETTLNTAREVVAVAKFLADESGIRWAMSSVDDRLCLLGIATEVVKARQWNDEIDGFNSETETDEERV